MTLICENSNIWACARSIPSFHQGFHAALGRDAAFYVGYQMMLLASLTWSGHLRPFYFENALGKVLVPGFACIYADRCVEYLGIHVQSRTFDCCFLDRQYDHNFGPFFIYIKRSVFGKLFGPGICKPRPTCCFPAGWSVDAIWMEPGRMLGVPTALNRGCDSDFGRRLTTTQGKLFSEATMSWALHLQFRKNPSGRR